ncbi:APC family permease [Providencia vermicola]|uniref:APC family permease n=3 Tax=Gammaproteobacteria TaxID=1236 RepID=A0AAI9HXR7_PROST|nr:MULTISPECIES: APC family permease [Providencia]ELR5044116.1 APC family permease [Providencia rettgeri]ELR5033997.1 APC family permease [Providencia stuartii]ELR5119637.1 APC family permease [Providencia stuartii]ELR5141381.1 APC family permease [Providencia stuartii]ELR5290739.1 APC family permease [Providencia stuartii]
MPNNSTPLSIGSNQTGANNRVELAKTLTLLQVVMIGLAYIQPMTIFDTFGMVSDKTGGHVPTSYIIALAAILFTALSYGKLVKRFPSAGSAYTYAQKSMSPHIGFLVGWTSLLSYIFMPMINILLAKIYLQDIFPTVEPAIFVVGLVILMTAANLRGINVIANLSTVIAIIQVGVMVVFTFIVIHGVSNGEGTGEVWTFRPFADEHTELIPLIAGATILCFSFLGFDGLSSLSEETPNAGKVIPRAIFLTALIGGIIFITVSFFLQQFFPDVSRFKNINETQPDIMRFVAGAFFQSIILVFSCVTVLASGMAAHAGSARLMYVMGRDGVFPEKIFGHVSPKWRTPSYNVLMVGVLALGAIWFEMDFATALINFGALIAFTFVNISVISQFFIRERRINGIKNILNYLILPVIGTLTVCVLWLNIEEDSMVYGLIWTAVGLVYMAILTRMFRRPMPQMSDY